MTSSSTRFERYVALGDSQAEGIGDGDERLGYRGWPPPRWRMPSACPTASPVGPTRGFGGDEAAMSRAAAGASVWLSWIVNLLIAEWWLLRRPGTPARAGRTG